jgi:hypothetical protein
MGSRTLGCRFSCSSLTLQPAMISKLWAMLPCRNHTRTNPSLLDWLRGSNLDCCSSDCQVPVLSRFVTIAVVPKNLGNSMCLFDWERRYDWVGLWCFFCSFLLESTGIMTLLRLLCPCSLLSPALDALSYYHSSDCYVLSISCCLFF